MSISKVHLLLIGLFLFTGCISRENKSNNISFEKTYNLKHESYNAELLISSGEIAVIDSFLLLINRREDPVCTVYAIKQGMKEIYTYGKLGGGPGEFLTPILTYRYNDTFGLCEYNKSELSIMQLIDKNGSVSISDVKHLKPHNKEIKKGELHIPDNKFTRLTKGYYVSTLFSDDGHFFKLRDKDLTELSDFGESPIPEKLSISGYINRMQGKIATNDGTMVYATFNLPYLAAYKLINNKMEKQWSFFYDEPHYGVRNGDLLFKRDKTFGIVLDLKMDSKYIYVLYLDILLSEMDQNNPEKSLANKVLVFDHKGKAVAKLNLDCRLEEMDISSSEGKLYGLAHLPEPTIVAFKLPKI